MGVKHGQVGAREPGYPSILSDSKDNDLRKDCCLDNIHNPWALLRKRSGVNPLIRRPDPVLEVVYAASYRALALMVPSRSAGTDRKGNGLDR